MTIKLNQYEGTPSLGEGFRPMSNDGTYKGIAVNTSGFVQVSNAMGVTANSLLRKDEWQMLDETVVEAASENLNAINRLKELGLVHPLGGWWVVESQFNVSSQMTRADVSLLGDAGGEGDRVDFLLRSVPIPVVFKTYRIPMRQLEASRRMGGGIDVTHAYEAGRVVAEEMERIFFAGDADIVLGGNTLFGVTNETNINTGVATGDWGTISNILPTVENMITACAADGYYGPFDLWCARNQYGEATLQVFTDGSGETPKDRIERMVQINEGGVHPADYLADGQLVLVQMTRNVIDYADGQAITNVEWKSGDGMVSSYKVMMVGAPRVKSDYENGSGICYYTGA